MWAQIERHSTRREDDPATAADEHYALASKVLDLGLFYELSPKWAVLLGTKQIADKGYLDSTEADDLHKTRMLGLRVKIGQRTAAQISWQQIDYQDLKAENKAFSGQNLSFTVNADF